MPERMIRSGTTRALVPNICLACLILVSALPADAALPVDDAAWVCVAPPEYHDALAPLAEHRARQGLTVRLVTPAEAVGWVGPADTFPPALRDFARAAVDEWGTRYLLIVGDHVAVPAPSVRYASGPFEWTAPCDLYYACHDGDWNADGDEWVGELDDDFDPEPDVALGRIPAADAAEAAAVVDKIIAFEGRTQADDGRVLVAATVLDDLWSQGDEPVPMIGNTYAVMVEDILLAAEREWSPDLLLQYADDPPIDTPLTPGTLVDALATSRYDHVMFLGQGNDDVWSCGEFRYVDTGVMEPLAGCGHSFVLDAQVPEGTDISVRGLASTLLMMPDGGAVAVRGWSTPFYITPSQDYDLAWWEALASQPDGRIGDLHAASLHEGWLDGPSEFGRAHLPLQGLLGDPATLARPAAAVTDVPTGPSRVVQVEAVPNPFNPSTVLAFRVEGPEGSAMPVRVEIFDLRGRKVATLLDAALPPGDHAVDWSADASAPVPDSLYFARVTAGTHAGVVKLVRLD